MYTGHVAIALGARAARRDVPLWVLVVAAQGPDWVETLLSAKWRHPAAEVWSHAVPGVLIAALALAMFVGVWKKSASAALIVLAVYLSHPVADLVTGYKPLWLGGPPLGLRFIDRPIADLITQSSVCIAGWVVYAKSLPSSYNRRLVVMTPLLALLILQAASDLVVFIRKPFRPSSSAVVLLSHRTDASCMGNPYEPPA